VRTKSSISSPALETGKGDAFFPGEIVPNRKAD
jgi:hypothetical protein